MIEKILKNIIKLIPDKSKNKIAQWVQYEHPDIWIEARRRTEEQSKGELQND